MNLLIAATIVTLSPALISLLAGPVTVLLTGLVTKYEASSGVKRLIALAASAVIGVLVEVVAGSGSFDIEQAALSALLVFASNVLSYVYALKPSNIADKVAQSTNGFIG